MMCLKSMNDRGGGSLRANQLSAGALVARPSYIPGAWFIVAGERCGVIGPWWCVSLPDGDPHLQWTLMGPSCPNCSLVLCTWPMKSMKPSPDLGTPCSGQSVNWNWRTVRDWPSWRAGKMQEEAPQDEGKFPKP